MLDVVDRFVGETDGERFSRRSVGEVGVFVRGEESAGRRAAMMAAYIDLESVVLGFRFLASEVPFSGKEGAVAAVLERFGDSGDIGGEILQIFCRKDTVVAIPFGP